MKKKTINYNFKNSNTIGNHEILACNKVLKSGKLSGFLGSPGKYFFGGRKVQEFENVVKKFYGVKYAISVNSWTSGLIAMIGSLDLEPGDEIIVPSWTMCATATSILHWNCIPVFADIDKESLCIDPEDVKKKITKKTKAVLVVDIFGYPTDIKQIRKVVGKKIKIISDNAQTPYGIYNGKISGTNTDIGGYSFNYHKHINTGEGGVVITNSKVLAERVQLIRNHGEAVIKTKIKKKLSNIIGHNFRLGELEAAIGIEQFKKLKKIVRKRQILCRRLTKGLLSIIDSAKLPKDQKNWTHNYYIYPIILNLRKLKVSREKIIELLEKEGVQGLIGGYTNIHHLPIFKYKIAYGTKGFPWSIYGKKFKKKYKYSCKVAEQMHKNTFMGIEVCRFDLNKRDIDLIIESFLKVWKKIKI